MDRDIADRDGNVDQQDIDDSGVGNEAGEEETEDLKHAVRMKTGEVCCQRSRARSAAGGAGRGLKAWRGKARSAAGGAGQGLLPEEQGED